MSEDQDGVQVCPEPQRVASVSPSSVGTLPKGSVFRAVNFGDEKHNFTSTRN